MSVSGQRFLMIYWGVLTAVFVVTVASGFASSPRTMTLEQLDVQRINLREPDGTLRMVMSSAGTSPGTYVKGAGELKETDVCSTVKPSARHPRP